DKNSSWFSLDFNMKKKFSSFLPTNIISPYEMDFAFMELLAPANSACRDNFDSLMVPFRCVVTDVSSSCGVTMKDGDLASAVRGSMSIPFVFKPITINDKLVFDGGMYNNFPADVAKNEFHPDVIIGSRVAARYSNLDRDDIISQIQVMLMGRQSDSISFPNSVLILPKIPEVNIISFNKTDEINDSGYVAAIREIPAIRKLISRQISPAEIAAKRLAFRQKCHPLVFDSIHVNGLNPIQSKYIILTLKHGKRTVSIDDIRSDYFRIIDEGFIKSIFPRSKYNHATGYYDLFLDVQKAESFTIQAGGILSIGANSEGFIELQYKNLWTRAVHFMANGYFGKFYSSVKVGGRIDFTSRKMWYLEGYYTYNHFDYFTNTVYFFDDKTPSYVIQGESFGDLRIGTPVTNKGRLVFSMIQSNTYSNYYQSNSFSRTDTSDRTGFTFTRPRLCFELNNLNRKQYASAGAEFSITGEVFLGMEQTTTGSTWLERKEVKNHHQWVSGKILWDNYFMSIGPVKLGFYGEGLISNQPKFANYMATVLYAPVFQPVPGMQTRFLPPFHATSYLGGGLKGILKIVKNVELRVEGYLFQPYQAIIENSDFTASFGKPFSDRAFLASGMVVYHTFLGPFSLGFDFYGKMADHWNLSFNFGYMIFNKSSIH
ncbi:MAG: patatin-like phospholipase family protein, partial [Syntrophothermus sp.]